MYHSLWKRAHLCWFVECSKMTYTSSWYFWAYFSDSGSCSRCMPLRNCLNHDRAMFSPERKFPVLCAHFVFGIGGPGELVSKILSVFLFRDCSAHTHRAIVSAVLRWPIAVDGTLKSGENYYWRKRCRLSSKMMIYVGHENLQPVHALGQ